MAIIIRKAKRTDANDIAKLNNVFSRSGATVESIENSLANNKQEIVMIAFYDGEAAGFICGELRSSMTVLTSHGEITELFVDEKFRRKGIAKKMMCEMEDEFKLLGISVVTLATAQNNVTAQTFYESCGYAGKLKYIYRKNI